MCETELSHDAFETSTAENRLLDEPSADAPAGKPPAGLPLAAMMYRDILRAFTSPTGTLFPALEQEGVELLARMNPRDAVEELLVAQLLATHARLLRLTFIAGAAVKLQSRKPVDLHAAADGAAGTFARQLQMLNDYRGIVPRKRRRRRRRNSITHIRHANFNTQNGGTQQIVSGLPVDSPMAIPVAMEEDAKVG